MSVLSLYRGITRVCAPLFERILLKRADNGKEDTARLNERRGIASIKRPDGVLFWLHAASVGEAQSALILINRLLNTYPDAHILVTSGTVTSAELMGKKLPARAFHHYVPLDHPEWVDRFLDFWRPNFAFWMESELWPNLVNGLKVRRIPSVLINARMSDRSYKRWKLLGGMASLLIAAFDVVFAQTASDADRYSKLGALEVYNGGNVKYSAAPLPYDENDLASLEAVIAGRPIWLYASTHAGEEALACRVHAALKARYPELLTIIVPRHPERRDLIKHECRTSGLAASLRSRGAMPDRDIYIADTLGELGLFYRLAPISLIGRSFSDDGGGGHNPIEAAQLGSAVLTGPRYMYQREIFDEMLEFDAALVAQDESDLISKLDALLADTERLSALQNNGTAFVESKARIIDDIEARLYPLINKALL
jgi:3-deoxy-D-manno-octulosonic-acid transferase